MKTVLQKWQKTGIAGILLVLSMPFLHAGHLSDELMISTKLKGSNEVPAVETDALGVASFTINSSWDTAFVNVSVNGLSGPITGIHVHEGNPGENGGVVTNLTPFVKGNRIITALTGDDFSAEKIAKYLSGKYYLNVHTEENPGGEIRGQLRLETDWPFRAKLSVMHQAGEVSHNIRGLGYLNLSHDKKEIEVAVVINGQTQQIESASLSLTPPDVDEPALINLGDIIKGNSFYGKFHIGDRPQLIKRLFEGEMYLHLKVANVEIRGRLWQEKNLAFDAWLNTDQEVTTPTGASGSGVAFLSLSPTLDTLWYEALAESLTGQLTGAHLHTGPVGVDGGVTINFTPDINGASISGMYTGEALTKELIGHLLKGETYVNLHTEMNPAGEIRGQVYRVAREGYTFSLEGNQEVPPVFTQAKGSGLASIDRRQTNVHFMMAASDLSGPLTGAHFHKGVMGENGGVIHPLTHHFKGDDTDVAAFGYWKHSDDNPFTMAHSVQFRHDSIYVNLHTERNPGGEIRGQVLRGAVEFEHQMPDNGMRPMDPMFQNHLLFSAKLTGDQEVPSVDTDANGTAGFLLNSTYDTLWVNINVDGLSGPITGIHVHEGAKGVNGGVVIGLTDMVMEKQIKGYITDFDLHKFMTGAYYVNVHTNENPGGEIRGQIYLETDHAFIAHIEGEQAVPAVETDAMGLGVFSLSADKSSLGVKIVSTGLSGPITGAHLHNAAKGVNGGVVVNLTPYIKNNSIYANVDPTDILDELMAGNIYVNIHTEENPGGEIRGQLMLTHNLALDAWMNGAQEVEEVMAPGRGVAALWFNSTWDSLYYKVVFDYLSGPANASHFHLAPVGVNGGVVVNLSGGIDGNKISGSVSGGDLTHELIKDLLTGQIYINVHTSDFPGGEIRGQVFRFARHGFSFDMCGQQEVPPVNDGAYGGGILSLDRYKSNAHLMFTTTNLTGEITGAHIHEGAKGVNGGVIYPVTDKLDGNSVFTYLEVDNEGASKILSGMTYVNVHTEENPGGEVRGQIDNTTKCPKMSTNVDNVNESGITSVYPNPFTDNLQIRLERNSSDKLILKIQNVQGRTVFEKQFVPTKNDLRIDLGDLPNGVYFMKIQTGDKEKIRKIVKR